MVSRRGPALASLVALVFGCDHAEPATCEDLGVQPAPITPIERHLLGRGSDYPAESSLDLVALGGSMAERRALGWRVAMRVFEPVGVADGVDVPRFRTWLDRDDLVRVFSSAYDALGAEGRRARAPLDDGSLEAALVANAATVTTLASWPTSRIDAYRAALVDEAAWSGLAGVRRVLASPSAATHLARSYAAIERCADDDAEEVVDESAITRRRVVLARSCAPTDVGPFVLEAESELELVADAETLDGHDAGTTPPASSTPFDVRSSDGAIAMRCEGRCVVTAEADTSLVVSFREAPASRRIELVSTLRRRAPSPTCVAGPFPEDAALVALEWRRADSTTPLVAYDTDAVALRRHLAESEPTWGEGDREVDPADDEVFAITTSAGARFRLAAMHIRTRELEHWVNVTLWWSDRPNDDFGADRPAHAGPLDHYKMCVTVDFEESDPRTSSSFVDSPTLAAALDVTAEGLGGATWCSNPYIDAAPGLARGNCVGCHQHASTGVRPFEVATDEARFPSGGRLSMVHTPPSDGFWGLDAGDLLGGVFSAELDWWDASDQSPAMR